MAHGRSTPTTPELLSLLLLFVPRWTESLMEKKFKAQGLLDLGHLGLASLDGSIIAIGDSNADQFRDIFSLSSDQRSVSLHLWDHQLYQFVSVAGNPVIPETVGGFVITNIIATDINYDGRLDILVMGSTEPAEQDNTLKMEVWYGQDGTSFAHGIPIPSSLAAHPLVFDSQGSMAMDLLGLPSSLPSVFKVWKNQASSAPSNSSTPFSIEEPPFNTPINCKLANPHSNTFIDLDGDCLADIFLTCQEGGGEQSYQIWINNKAAGFSLARTGALPFGTKHVSFADMDRDGTIDMLLTVCPSADSCSIHVAYNQQIPLCTSRTQSTCRDAQNLCTADPDFRFSFESSSSGFTTLSIAHLFPDFNLVTELTSSDFLGPSPVSVQVGDYNLDGYPDLLLVVERAGSRGTETRGVPWLLESVACGGDGGGGGGCTELETRTHRRTFRPLSTGTEPLAAVNDAISAFFLDVNEDGSLDVVIQRAHPHNHNAPAARAISVFKNNFFNDAFFLKAIMLNGACSSRCLGKDGRADYRPYGVNYAGASYKFTIQDTFGERRATAVGQIPFSMYASPQSPYSFFGLGRTNNYVEKMYVGSTRHQREHYMSMEGLLPNSQLVVIPFQPPGLANPNAWKKELYLHPADWIPWVSLFVAAATLLLAALVAVLHLNEKREDERERRRKAHTINFDAL